MANPIFTSGFDAKYKTTRTFFRMASKEGAESIAYRNHQEMFNVITDQKGEFTDYIMRGMGNMPLIKDGESRTLPVASGVELSPTVTYRTYDYGYKFLYTKRAAELDEIDLIRNTVASMGEGGAETIEQTAASFFDRGLVDLGGWDNKPLYATDHQYLGGRTYSNILPSSGASFAAVAAIYKHLHTGITTDEGHPIILTAKCIHLRPEDFHPWSQLIASTTQIGQSNPNVINPLSQTPGLLNVDMLKINGRLKSRDLHIQCTGHHNNMAFSKPLGERSWNINEPEAMVVATEASFVVGYTDARRNILLPGIGGV